LEAFLAALIKEQSGGATFDVTDLHAVFRVTAVLLVLDGLDEVADVKRRTDVVTEITKGIERLKPIAASFQVVVTSRPTAFANTPGLPEKMFQYFGLDSVTPELIDEYANKWLKARKLQERESSEVKKILREKLGQPHMRDLARNPMQLAILPTLIHTQGTSLTKDPDFRLLSHPRVLAATLLGDWVFTQHPKSVSEVIRLILDGIGIRFLLTSNSRRLSHSQPLSLPASCGRSELVAKCFALLRDGPPNDFALDVLDLLRADSKRDELLEPWRKEVESAQGVKRTAWLNYGMLLGCISATSQAELTSLLSDSEINADRVDVLLKAERRERIFGTTAVVRCAARVSRGQIVRQVNQRSFRSCGPGSAALGHGAFAMGQVNKFECQKAIVVHYDGVSVGDFFADMLVGEKVMLELKANQTLAPANEVQLVNYLTATGVEVGLLLNFGAGQLEFKRKSRTYRPKPLEKDFIL
jgi:hypothetical protein